MSDDARELSVLVVCHHCVCSISTRWVERLLASSDVERRPAAEGCGVLQVGSQLVGAFSLGQLLGLTPQENAWVLLRLSLKETDVQVALSVDACLSVVPRPAAAPLPTSLFRKRAGAIRGAFSAAQAGVTRANLLLGLDIDPQALLTNAELAAVLALQRATKAGPP